MLVYLSGKMSGLPGYGYDRFTRAAAILRESDYDVLNPAETAGGITHLPRETFMAIDIGYVMAADAVVVLDGWGSSKGAKLEMILADSLSKPIFAFSEERGLGPQILPNDWHISYETQPRLGEPYPDDNETAWSPKMGEVL